MINHQAESMMTLAEASEYLRPMRPNIATSTLYRWTLKGVRNIALEFVQVGGIRLTSKQALDRFFEAIKTAPRTRQSLSSPLKAKNTARQKRRDKASKEAARVLARATRG